MTKVFFCFLFLGFNVSVALSQASGTKNDSVKINNLILPPGYKCSTTGEIPQYTKTGRGKQSLILIPGLGFDKSVFDDFIKANKKKCTIYCITIPGYGNSQAPPLPPTGTSFGDQTWNKSILEGIKKLIAREQIKKPIIVGHFVQGTQLALRMAIDYPELVSGVIILGGPAKFILINNGKPVEYPLANSIKYIDKITAPNWFGTISKKDFDDGNYLPEIYSIDSSAADILWHQTASVSLPVMIHYLCEFFASDVTLETEKIKCPVLVLRPTFNEEILNKAINNYLIPQFINSWDKVKAKNPLFQVADIPHAATFLWKDNPEAVNKQINLFINQFKKQKLFKQ